MFRVGTGRVRPLYTTVTVNGNPLSMEVDTGASITSLETFKTIREGESPLSLGESDMKLQTYTGEPIQLCGSTNVQVSHNGQTFSLPLVVTEGEGPTLLGRNWLEALCFDWRAIFTVCSNNTLQAVLDKHSVVFTKELGKLQGAEAKIYIKDDARPRFEKSGPVPFTIREKVEEELDCLQTSDPSDFLTGQHL